jgi:SnoaL-like domain
MDNAQTVVERYLEAFNETDADRRATLLETLYDADSVYTDPHVEARGPGQIGAFIEQTQERFPGHSFALHGPVDAHHGQARFQWQAGPQEEPCRYVGFDVIVAEDGRIRSVYGFIDAAPAQ